MPECHRQTSDVVHIFIVRCLRVAQRELCTKCTRDSYVYIHYLLHGIVMTVQQLLPLVEEGTVCQPDTVRSLLGFELAAKSWVP